MGNCSNETGGTLGASEELTKSTILGLLSSLCTLMIKALDSKVKHIRIVKQKKNSIAYDINAMSSATALDHMTRMAAMR